MRRLKSQFQGPSHPWQKTRIDAEREILRSYGLKNKSDIWKANSLLKKFTENAKTLIPKQTTQAEKEKEQLLSRLARLGLMPTGSQIEEVLGLTIGDILERRLQSVVFKKGMARSMKQARQFITHEHLMIDGQKITSPSYLVSKAEEGLLAFATRSVLIDGDHPERKPLEKKVKSEETKVEGEATEEEKTAEPKVKEEPEAPQAEKKEASKEKPAEPEAPPTEEKKEEPTAEEKAPEPEEVKEEAKAEEKAEAKNEEVPPEEGKE